MAAETFRIEIPINVEDNTDPGVSSAREKMTKFDQANEKVKKRLDEMNKTKWRVAIETVDKVTSVISKIGTTVKGITTKVWSVTLSAVDKVTGVAKGIISTLGEVLSIGTMVSTVLGGLTLMDALDAANTQTQVETQLSTVLKNMADSAEEAESIFDRIKTKASELQQVTLYGDEGYIAGAAELATYFSDADALELMMDTLADYATGMSGGAELTTEELVDYATNLGKITTGAYDAMTKKGFEFTDAQKAVIDGTATQAQYIEALGEDWASMSEEMRTAQVISDIIEESWSGLATEMANLPSAKITQFKNAWGDVKEVIGNKLYPAVGDFFAMLSDKLPEVQELLESGAEWLADAFEDLIPSISDGIDTAINWVKKLADTIKEMVNSDEWQNADLFGKISIAWDTLIAEPFSEWWNSTGRAYFAEKAGSIGEAIGSGLTTGLLALLGIDISDAMTDGTSVGGAFIEGFKKGFDTEQITAALKEWASNNKEVVVAIGAVVGFNLITGLASKLNSLTTLIKGLSGNSSDSSGTSLGDLITNCTTMTVTASVVNVYGATVNSATTSTLTSAGSALKGLLPTAGGAAIGAGAGKLITSGAGQLLLGSGTGNTIAGYLTGTTATTAAETAASTAGGVGAHAVWASVGDGTEVLLGTTGSAATAALGNFGTALGTTATTAGGAAVAGGAAAGGIIGGILGLGSAAIDLFQGIGKSKEGDTKGAKDEYVTAGTKAGMVGAGAATGAAIGSIVPGAGTAIGALVGAGVGGAAALIGGNKAGKAISDSTDEGGALSNAWQSTKGFFTQTVPQKGGELLDTVSPIFTETIPQGWNSFWDNVGNFFTQTVPQWWGNTTDTVSTFFTETIPEKWNELWEEVGSFFTESVPYAIGYACGKIEIFFTETVPEFFGDLWDSISTFFTDTLPTWASGIWNDHIVPFFTESIPEFFGGIWDAIKTFFTDTLPTWASGIWNEHIVPFFTETIPTFFSGIWSAITTFFTDTLPTWASSLWNGHIVPFFTESVPTFFSNLWETIVTFFTDTLPTWASNLWNNNIKPFFTESIPNFLSSLWTQITTFVTETIPSIASSIASTVSGWFSSIGDWISNIWEKAKSSFSLGYNDATGSSSKHAWGGIMNAPHVGMVAEDGPEAIIPLSPSKSARGLDLWLKAGQQLGVKPYADGGIVGDANTTTTAITADTATATTAGGNTFEINMEVNPTFRIEGSESMNEEAIVAILKARIKEMVDGIADELAERLARTFANMPVKGSA